MRYAFLGALALTAFFVATSPGHSQPQQPKCAPPDVVLSAHAAAGEKIVAKGKTSSDADILVLADKKGNWHIILISPDQTLACLAAQGDGWKNIAPSEGI